ncbi:MAG TPA: hypothetical protein VGG74_11865 [Kofleriaceae bacterium]|jgi:hypothetical protein
MNVSTERDASRTLAGREAPRPNCGHAAATFVFVALIEQWLCKRCIQSIGALYDVCSSCGTSLEACSATFRAERFCSIACRDGQLSLGLGGL